MFNVIKKSLVWGDKELILETGKIARQADGAVMVTYGETKLLCTVVAAKEDSENDFFPLTVHYIEKFYSVGKIPGGYLKREGRPSEKETLISRLIDRPIRPLFPNNFKNEVQVICQVLSHDGISSTEIPAIIGASAALTISGIPFYGPLGASKVGRIKNDFILNPTNEQLSESDLDLVVAGTKDGVLMVESEARDGKTLFSARWRKNGAGPWLKTDLFHLNGDRDSKAQPLDVETAGRAPSAYDQQLSQ